LLLGVGAPVRRTQAHEDAFGLSERLDVERPREPGDANHEQLDVGVTMNFEIGEQDRRDPVGDQAREPFFVDAWLVEAPDDVAGIARALGGIARA